MVFSTGDAAEGVIVAIIDCQEAEIERQDATLNEVYKAAMARLDELARKRLRAEERFWIARRRFLKTHSAAR